MTPGRHARILNAYISRLTPADLESIVKADQESWHASMNLSTSSQLEAQHKSYEVILAAIENMLENDRNCIEAIMERHMEAS